MLWWNFTVLEINAFTARSPYQRVAVRRQGAESVDDEGGIRKGTLQVPSNVGKGTAFTVKLPVETKLS
jgi:hypothetical protein